MGNEIPIPLEADHSMLCRFDDIKNENFQILLDCLRDLIKDPDFSRESGM